jgi:hypothetical protein
MRIIPKRERKRTRKVGEAIKKIMLLLCCLHLTRNKLFFQVSHSLFIHTFKAFFNNLNWVERRLWDQFLGVAKEEETRKRKKESKNHNFSSLLYFAVTAAAFGLYILNYVPEEYLFRLDTRLESTGRMYATDFYC